MQNTKVAPMVQIPKEYLKSALVSLSKEEAGDAFLSMCDYVVNGVTEHKFKNKHSEGFYILLQEASDRFEESYAKNVAKANKTNEMKRNKTNNQN